MILLACGGWTLVRTGGFSGYIDHDFAWRWTKTPEERLLAQANDEPPARPAPATPAAAAEDNRSRLHCRRAGSGRCRCIARERHDERRWPGFRGPPRDGVVRGVQIDTDWTKSPPVELWRRPIGPGWSSFAVHGDLFYTQEQRGEDEIVARLQPEHRQAGVAASRRGTVLGIERRRRAARDADARQRPRLRAGRDRHPQRARRRQRRGRCGRTTRRPIPARRFRTGASRVHRWSSTTW